MWFNFWLTVQTSSCFPTTLTHPQQISLWPRSTWGLSEVSVSLSVDYGGFSHTYLKEAGLFESLKVAILCKTKYERHHETTSLIPKMRDWSYMLPEMTAGKASKTRNKVREDFVFIPFIYSWGTERNLSAFEKIRAEWQNRTEVILPEYEKQCLNCSLEDVL